MKASAIKGVIRFDKKHMLIPHYISPFEIFKCVGPMTYRLDLPPNLSGIYLVFHISMLNKYDEVEDFCHSIGLSDAG